ncbi:transcriptional regulator containing PAS, AAA-type ATPase, and DNA-binding domains [Desulfitobacterium dehalogenans ATCC 51507]|uniref:Transcriptional regulator containing PAS, AAA-type ATPase, and DNA-binding domains n=1 Tax=Desulfitobacterium dehalogenans (strain ATCC 51507 / DSM 9161 / JW/IU-DC1) TaxID=756499 RepID=I4A5X9_DESDJ|nr:sigma 54-interacting transcriptional regulator [Desulfitobacterium dehalogenans]AFL99363.1 transcriptional regulator containing PAS, AAA-type ATPase, and DNA-binding domains [Desulfitobacterium dehalogenans ATCC 51507]
MRVETVVARILNTGCVLIDGWGVVCSIDWEVAQLLHVEPSEALGRRLTEIFPETRLLEVLVTQQQLLTEQVINKRKVRVGYYPVTTVQDFSGVVMVVESLSPVPPENQEHQALIDLYEGILSELPLGLAVVNRQGRVVFMNDYYSQSMECSSEVLMGLPLQKHVPFSKIAEILHIGKPRLQIDIEYRGKVFLLSESPIVSRGQTIGGISKVLSREEIEGQDFRSLTQRVQVLENKLLFYKEELLELRSQRSPLDEIQGKSSEILKLKQVVERVAQHDANVLITGESGTGKGLVAQTIHQLSPRKEEPFIKINCAAIPENLLESELFGYEEGAFTGALKGGKPGKFELAQGGTIFLDEIGDMPLTMQAKILRVLQEKSFERIGGSKTLTVNVRIIAATHRNLVKLIDEGQFRLDLYYRIAVISMDLPPLRKRPLDIQPLAAEIIQKLQVKYGRPIHGLTTKAEKILHNYSWPGNVRELENVLEYAFNFLEPGERVIAESHLPSHIIQLTSSSKEVRKPLSRDANPFSDTQPVNISLEDAVAKAEIEAILRALELTQGNKQAAARVLGIHVSGLYQKLKKYADSIES